MSCFYDVISKNNIHIINMFLKASNMFHKETLKTFSGKTRVSHYYFTLFYRSTS